MACFLAKIDDQIRLFTIDEGAEKRAQQFFHRSPQQGLMSAQRTDRNQSKIIENDPSLKHIKEQIQGQLNLTMDFYDFASFRKINITLFDWS